MAVSAWTLLDTLASILIPFITLILTGLGIVVWQYRNELHTQLSSFEQRLTAVEQRQSEHGRSLYGADGDGMQNGVIHEVLEMKEQIDFIEQTLREQNGDLNPPSDSDLDADHDYEFDD